MYGTVLPGAAGGWLEFLKHFARSCTGEGLGFSCLLGTTRACSRSGVRCLIGSEGTTSARVSAKKLGRLETVGGHASDGGGARPDSVMSAECHHRSLSPSQHPLPPSPPACCFDTRLAHDGSHLPALRATETSLSGTCRLEASHLWVTARRTLSRSSVPVLPLARPCVASFPAGRQAVL